MHGGCCCVLSLSSSHALAADVMLCRPHLPLVRCMTQTSSPPCDHPKIVCTTQIAVRARARLALHDWQQHRVPGCFSAIAGASAADAPDTERPPGGTSDNTMSSIPPALPVAGCGSTPAGTASHMPALICSR